MALTWFLAGVMTGVVIGWLLCCLVWDKEEEGR